MGRKGPARKREGGSRSRRMRWGRGGEGDCGSGLGLRQPVSRASPTWKCIRRIFRLSVLRL